MLDDPAEGVQWSTRAVPALEHSTHVSVVSPEQLSDVSTVNTSSRSPHESLRESITFGSSAAIAASDYVAVLPGACARNNVLCECADSMTNDKIVCAVPFLIGDFWLSLVSSGSHNGYSLARNPSNTPRAHLRR
jgi:hypothetical protein